MPAELLEQFSKRTAEVDKALAVKLTEFYQREGRDPSRFERAALGREAAVDTRAHKTGNGVPDLKTRWLTVVHSLSAEARNYDSPAHAALANVIHQWAQARGLALSRPTPVIERAGIEVEL